MANRKMGVNGKGVVVKIFASEDPEESPLGGKSYKRSWIRFEEVAK